MIQDRYYLTTGSEALLKQWYKESSITEVNGHIDEVFKCLYQIRSWSEQQKELFHVLINEFKWEVE